MPEISKEMRYVKFDEDSEINELHKSFLGQRPTSCHKTMFDYFKELCTKIVAKNSLMTERYDIFFNSDVVSMVENVAGFITNIWSSHFPVNVSQPTKEELLYCFFGIWPKLAQAPQWLHEYDENQHNVFYYILKWVNSYFCGHQEIFKDIKTCVNGEKLENALEALTVSKEMEGINEPSIDSDFQRAQSALSWVFKYISHVISSHILMSKDACAGYQQHKRSFWFTETIGRGFEHQANPSLQRQIHMINISENDNFTDKEIKEHCNPGTELWYHGTNTFDAADSIIKEGIDLSKCWRPCDFSNGSGFYVSNSYERAKIWASKWNHRCAIVVFKMNIDSSEWNVLDINNNENWRKVIRYHRFQVEPEEGLKFVIPKGTVEIELPVADLDCIKGYICSNPNAFKRDAYRGRDFIYNGGIPVTQMCVRKEPLAAHFGSLGNICAVIWFSRN